MRSPAEYYIRYRLIKEPNRPVEDLERDLRQELVFSPHKDYMAGLREEITVPKVFHPERLTDLVASALIRKHQVWTMWHGNRPTKEALEIFHRPRARALLQTLLAGPHPLNVVLDVFIRKSGMMLSDAGLDQFVHYFWNLKLLSAAHLLVYVNTFIKDPVLADVVDVKSTPDGMMYALAKIGVVPNIIDEAQLYEAYQRMFFLNSLSTEKSLRPGLSKSTALKMDLESVKASGDWAKEIRTARGEDVEAHMQRVVETVDFSQCNLKQLGEGMVPLPLSLLNQVEEMDSEEVGVSGGAQ